MRYWRIEKEDGRMYEIQREEARKLLSRNYQENVCTFDEMLDTPGDYPCMFCTLVVRKK